MAGSWFDYARQAWVADGVYQDCGHPQQMDCNCYGRAHQGETADDEVRADQRRRWLEYLKMDERAFGLRFDELGRWLEDNELPARNGAVRSVSAAEFMMMAANDQTVDFKHIHSRSYLYLVQRPIVAAIETRAGARGVVEVRRGECLTQVGATFDGPGEAV